MNPTTHRSSDEPSWQTDVPCESVDVPIGIHAGKTELCSDDVVRRRDAEAAEHEQG